MEKIKGVLKGAFQDTYSIGKKIFNGILKGKFKGGVFSMWKTNSQQMGWSGGKPLGQVLSSGLLDANPGFSAQRAGGRSRDSPFSPPAPHLSAGSGLIFLSG